MNLCNRCSVCITLGWMGALEPVSASRNQLDICKLSRQGPPTSLNVAFSVTIQGDFSWTLHICGREVESQKCSLLAHTPDTLVSVSGVLVPPALILNMLRSVLFSLSTRPLHWGW